MIIGKFIIWIALFLVWAVVIGLAAIIIAQFIKILIRMFSEDNVDKK